MKLVLKLLVCSILILCSELQAQKLNVVTYRRDNPFLGSQWYLGPRAGTNLAMPSPINRFSVLSANNTFDNELYDKEYSSSNNVGAQYGVQLIFKFSHRFMAVTMPTFVNYRFRYEQQIAWVDSNQPTDVSSTDYTHDHRFNYLELPLMLRFEVKEKQAGMWNRQSRKPKIRTFTPYVQLGPYLDFRLNANKDVTVVQKEDGFSSQINELNINVNRQVNVLAGGIMAGGGMKVKINSFYLTAEANYKLGLSNVINPGRRYTEPRMVSGAYDVFDDVRISALELNIGILIPLKYLTPGNALPVEP